MKTLIFLSLLPFCMLQTPFRQAREIAQRRQALIGYTNNVFHENPSYPADQTAQSSVNVNFNPGNNQVEAKPLFYASQGYRPQSTASKIVKEYTPQYQTSQVQANQPQSQLFNVGYSVSFTNAQPKTPPLPPKYSRPSLDDGEIITGTRKQNEQVQVPNINMSPEDFVQTALIDSKKHKLSGIKPKASQYVQNYPNPKVLLNQANLSPTTQKYFKALESAKPQTGNPQDLQQRYSWRNIGPGIEIIRSTEVPTQKYSSRSEPPELARDLEYGNQVEARNGQNSFYQFNQKVQQPPITRMIAKLPVDTSLLHQPVPIQVDTRYLEEAMRKHQFNYNPNPVQFEPSSQETLYRSYHRPEQYQDYHQAEQSRFQYKIYGKPQPQLVYQEQQVRQPRFLSDLHTNLRPPPFGTALTYQRRVHVGY